MPTKADYEELVDELSNLIEFVEGCGKDWYYKMREDIAEAPKALSEEDREVLLELDTCVVDMLRKCEIPFDMSDVSEFQNRLGIGEYDYLQTCIRCIDSEAGPKIIYSDKWIMKMEGYLFSAERSAKEAKAVGQANPVIKKKRSTQKGEGDDKLISVLTLHHKYADGGCLNLEPIGNNDIARLAEVSTSTASEFFKKRFGGHHNYKYTCGNTGRLIEALKELNGEKAR